MNNNKEVSWLAIIAKLARLLSYILSVAAPPDFLNYFLSLLLTRPRCHLNSIDDTSLAPIAFKRPDY
jgi:hypothetical protein